jgi:hypothetical protein
MPHDGATPAPVLNGTAKKVYTPGKPIFDFTKPLAWSADGNWATEFNELIRNPPLHSVVIDIAPKVAEQLMKLSNTKNRPKQTKHSQRICVEASSGSYEVTGDTIKFSKKGVLLDGQHRLDGCIKGKTAITSHVVFGLDDDVFDVLDQGKKRTPGDILALCGIPEATMVAGAISWVLRFEAGLDVKSDGSGSLTQRGEITPRKIRTLALGKMKDIASYVKDARLVNTAYKHPPTMIAGLLYLIGKRDPNLARDFAHEWVHGAKIGRNKNFDILNQRIMSIANANNGVVHRGMRAALLIQTFNHWNSHIVATPRALTWRKGWTFPTLEFNADSFREGKTVQDRENTSLPAVKYRVHYVLTQMQDKNCESTVSIDEIARIANVSKNSVNYILAELCKGRQISKVRDGKKGAPATYRVNIGAVEIKKVEAEE